MTLEPVIKIDKRNTATLKKFFDNVIFANCNAIVRLRITSSLEAPFLTHGLENLHFYLLTATFNLTKN